MSNDIYYNKYIKYKTKYLQLADNYKNNNNNILDINRCIEDTNGVFLNLTDCKSNNQWKDTYIELYYILLNIVSNQKEISSGLNLKIKSLCTLLFKNLKLVYNSKIITNTVDKRIINYNMRFIINIVSMLINKPFESFINDDTKIEFNKEQSLDDNNFYYLEDAFINDLDLFFSEYDNLLQTKSSVFFYRSNLVNISILLKCFSDKCIEKINSNKSKQIDDFYTHLYDQINKSNNFEIINNNFIENKYIMIKLLLEAYNGFSYEKVKKIYIKYLNFFYENFSNLELVITKKDQIKKSLDIIITMIENSGKDIFIDDSNKCYFVYLSCNLPSELKFEKYEATRILISYLGFRSNPDDFYNSIDIIEHDFGDFHNQYNRKYSYSSDELLEFRNFFKLLYNTFNTDQNMLDKIIKHIHNMNYENGLPKFKIIDFYKQIRNQVIIKSNNVLVLINFYIENYKKANKLLSEKITPEFMVKLRKHMVTKITNVEYLSKIDIILLIKILTETINSNNIDIIKELCKFIINNNELTENNLDIIINLIKVNNFTENNIINSDNQSICEIMKLLPNKRIDNNKYTIDLNKELSSIQTSFIKKIIRKVKINIDEIYAFENFLNINYSELIRNEDKKLHENLSLLF